MKYPDPPDFLRAFIEPDSAANTAYPPDYRYNHVTETPRGHMFEMDDTVDRERIRLQHRMGTFIEMHPNGDEVHKVYGDGYEITVKNKNVLIKGHCNITIEGDVTQLIKGNKVERVEGNYELHVMGDYNLIGEQTMAISSTGDMEINAGGAATGALSISTGDALMINTDLSIDGELVANKISCYGRIDSAVGMSAGPYGFVTTLGGVSVGLPAAVPFEVNCVGPINSLASMSAPLGSYGVHGSILSFDAINEMLRSVHNHIAPLGPTSPPLVKETVA
jgi:hypothetical protein